MKLGSTDLFPGRRATRVLLSIAALGWLASLAAPLQAQVLYRWINDQGRQEISHAIPTDMVHRGYEILDGGSMRVHKVVPPQMTDAEYTRRLEQEQALAACEAALDRVNFLYETPEDIDEAEVAAQRSLKVRLQNAQQSLNMAKKNLSVLEAGAASIERQGGSLDQEKLGKIEKANSQIARLEREMRQRESEQEKAVLAYEEERRMFSLGNCNSERPIANR